MPLEEERYRIEVERTENLAADVPAVIGRRDTIEAALHERMLSFAAPLISAYPGAHWITIGDGGGDGLTLSRLGARRVTASNISDARLRKLARDGLLPDIETRSINAEAINLADCEVDFVICKEAFHHFPRAPIAFYEFMRIARLGVLLIEPVEVPGWKPLDILRSLAKMILRQRPPIYELFEPVGNFIYRVSTREVFRSLAAIQRPWFAVRTFNSFSTRRLIRRSRQSISGGLTLRIGLLFQDILSACGLMSPGMAAVFIPTGAADGPARDALRNAGFRIVTIPANPYGRGDIAKKFLGDD